MADDSPEPLSYAALRTGADDDPVSAVTSADARRSGAAYPRLVLTAPAFGSAEQLDDGSWRVVAFGAVAPQGARDALACHFRRSAEELEEAEEADRDGLPVPTRGAFRAAAALLDRERYDELRVAGRRYRIFRADQFLRTGPDGVEPPRPSDPDPAPVGKGHTVRSRIGGALLDPAVAAESGAALSHADLEFLVPGSQAVPRPVRADAVLAARTHPTVVVLPAQFAVAELAGGYWGPTAAPCSAPQAARDSLTSYLREFAPRLMPYLGAKERARYAEAADRLDAERGDEVEAGGRRFRIVRVQPAVRLGLDGPEPPRRTDPDPDLPPEAEPEAHA